MNDPSMVEAFVDLVFIDVDVSVGSFVYADSPPGWMHCAESWMAICSERGDLHSEIGILDRRVLADDLVCCRKLDALQVFHPHVEWRLSSFDNRIVKSGH